MKYLISALVFLFLFASSVAAIDFTISNPSVVNDEVTVDVNVLGLSSPNYLQGMFTKSTTSPAYFGHTQNNHEDWYKYSGAYTKEEIVLNFFSFSSQNSSWSGQLKIKNDPDDQDYLGPGSYVLRVKRYTGNSDSAAQTSNDLNVDLAYVLATPTPTETPTATPVSTPVPTAAPTQTPTAIPTAVPTATTAIRTIAPLSTVSATAGAVAVTESADDLILGLRNELASVESSSVASAEGNRRKFSLFPAILIVSGLGCIAGAIFAFKKNAQVN